VPITTAIRIIIALAGQTDQLAPPSRYLIVQRSIRLWEMPPADSCAFALRVSEGAKARESQLSDAESEHLTTLLAQLPSHSMVSEVASFDGIMYELIVMQAEQPLSFHWQNDDWRHTPQSPLDKWERVAAVADYALSLAESDPPSTPPVIHNPRQQPAPPTQPADVWPGGIGDISARLGYDVRELLMEGYTMHDIQGVLQGEYSLRELRQRKPGRAARKKRWWWQKKS